jgi:hypothetical protein
MTTQQELDLLIKEARVKYGEVFLVEVEDDIYLFRLLTRQEYKEILQIADDKDMAEELVCQVAVLYPKDINFAQEKAGIPALLAPHIVNESGFGTLQKSHYYFSKYKEEMNKFEMQAEATIQAAFPMITEEEMQTWTVNKFMRMLAKAEWVLNNIKGYDIAFKDVTEEATEGETPEPAPPPSMKEIGTELRKQGIDPMKEFAHIVAQPRPFAEFPYIAGTNYWKRVFQ